MRFIVLTVVAICFSFPAFAGVVNQDSVACSSKDPLDILTVLASAGDSDVLTKAEAEYLEKKECIRMSKGASVEIVDAKRVIAGDPKIRGNQPHRRVSYHIATIRLAGKAMFMHLANIDD